LNTKQILKDMLVAIQYLFVAAGATILVPILTGIPVSVCLFSAGVGTLLFHFITKKEIPVLLSSSFAFIAPIIAVSEVYGINYAFGGIVVAGLIYLVFSVIIYFVGLSFIKKLFPTTVTATMVILIGIILAPVAISSASQNWIIAFITLAVGAFIKIVWEKNFFGTLSVIIAIMVGYIISIPFGYVDLSIVSQASFIGFPEFSLPAFNLSAISIIAPIAIVTFLEHFADISAVSKVVEKDFLKDPGVHKTLIGDGLATSIAGLIGGCPNTTYSENIGALEITGVKRAVILRYTAIALIVISFFPKIAFSIHSVPPPVVGGISILLFGLISSNGIKNLIQEEIDLKNFKNTFVIASMLVIGTGGTLINIGGVEFSSLAIAALIGVILNFSFNWKDIIYNDINQ
jgi:uracil permease